jgi:hypothetical protein
VPPLAKATITTPVSNGVGDHNTRQITSIDKNAGTLEDTQCASAGVAGERGGGGNGGQAIWRCAWQTWKDCTTSRQSEEQ